MKFGIWLDFRNPPRWRRPWTDIYRESLKLADVAEQLGLESVWLSEHHFTDDGYLPSVFPALAALAARTIHIRLGTAVLLAPLHHPLRLAEDAAVVDQLSAGRLELGIAPGYRQHEFDQLHIPRNERGSRTDETIEVLRRAWTGRPFDFNGRHFRYDGVTVNPPPYQHPHPRIWIGGSSRASATRAGRHGCHFLPDAGAPDELVELYRATLTEHGHDAASFEITRPATVYTCEDAERGWAEISEHLLYSANLYRAWAGHPPLPSAASLDRSRYIIGPPKAIVGQIRAMKADRLIFWARPPGLPYELAYNALQLFARDVVPLLPRPSSF